MAGDKPVAGLAGREIAGNTSGANGERRKKDERQLQQSSASATARSAGAFRPARSAARTGQSRRAIAVGDRACADVSLRVFVFPDHRLSAYVICQYEAERRAGQSRLTAVGGGPDGCGERACGQG